MRWLSLFLLLALPAYAQAEGRDPWTAVEEAALLKVLRGGTRELLVLMPNLVWRDLAEELRLAAVERGVRVYIVVPPGEVSLPGSHLIGLGLLKNVATRLYPVSRPLLVVDRRVAIQGEDQLGLTVWKATEDRSLVGRLTAQAVETYYRAQPFSAQRVLEEKVVEVIQNHPELRRKLLGR